jgi:hypothetical protein
VWASGADSDLFIIQFLPMYLANTSRPWLNHLSRDSINCWEDLKEIFTGHFQGTYIWPDNPWDLKGCQQKQGESLRDYIRHFSHKWHELPKICVDISYAATQEHVIVNVALQQEYSPGIVFIFSQGRKDPYHV